MISSASSNLAKMFSEGITCMLVRIMPNASLTSSSETGFFHYERHLPLDLLKSIIRDAKTVIGI